MCDIINNRHASFINILKDKMNMEWGSLTFLLERGESSAEIVVHDLAEEILWCFKSWERKKQETHLFGKIWHFPNMSWPQTQSLNRGLGLHELSALHTTELLFIFSPVTHWHISSAHVLLIQKNYNGEKVNVRVFPPQAKTSISGRLHEQDCRDADVFFSSIICCPILHETLGLDVKGASL